MSEFKPGFLFCPKCGHQDWCVLGKGNEFEIQIDDDLELNIYGCKCNKCKAVWFGTQDLCCEIITADEWVKKTWDQSDREAALMYKAFVDGQIAKGANPEKYKIASPVRCQIRKEFRN